MSIITDFLAILGVEQMAKSARNSQQDKQPHYSDSYTEEELYTSFDVEDIYDEELDEVIEEEWD